MDRAARRKIIVVAREWIPPGCGYIIRGRCAQCPRASPIAFTEYRSAGAVLCLSPRGDTHTGTHT
uniref:Uncharacterized protein n=1 Tax=Nonomuraea gerenzanensis TaxID=93944 RepID=A0A1M4EQ71_9ACTN|nr:hypothetical protein BN4615_P10527 [Nonomuraea gerenzanensis]